MCWYFKQKKEKKMKKKKCQGTFLVTHELFGGLTCQC